MSNQKLKKVKPYRTANLSRILKLVFFTWIFTLIGLLIAFLNFDLIKPLYIFIPAIGVGSIIGFYIGNLFTKFYENNNPPFLKILFLPLYPHGILYICNRTLKAFKLNDYFLVYGIGLLIVLPFFLYLDFKTIHYCENCQKRFQSFSIFSYRKVSPYQVLFLLENKPVFPRISELENDYSFPRYPQKESNVAITVDYCPNCYDAVVSGLLTYKVGSIGKERRDILFYSDIWKNGLFKDVFKNYFK